MRWDEIYTRRAKTIKNPIRVEHCRCDVVCFRSLGCRPESSLVYLLYGGRSGMRTSHRPHLLAPFFRFSRAC